MKSSEEPLTIFYTDDDKDDQALFTEVVGEIERHVTVYTQNNGKELLEMLENPPPRPHLVFLDLNMPVKNGYDVLRELKNKKDQYTPVIIFSTSDDDRAVSLSRDLGASLFVTKPASYTEYKKTLAHVLSIDWQNRDSDDNDFHIT